jgi:hypothetical protein
MKEYVRIKKREHIKGYVQFVGKWVGQTFRWGNTETIRRPGAANKTFVKAKVQLPSNLSFGIIVLYLETSSKERSCSKISSV